MTRTFLLLGLVGLLTAGCSGSPQEAAPEPTALVRTAVATSTALEDAVTAYGRVEFDPADGQTLTAPVEARVTALSVVVGQAVSPGTVIATLQASPAARVELDRAARDAATAEAEYRRLERLKADGLAADNEVIAARAAAATASETSRSLRAQAGDGLIVLRAGRAGVLDALPVNVGDVVPIGGPVARVGGLGSLRARLGLEPGQAARIAPGMTVRLSGLTPGGRTFVGRVLSVDRRVDPATRLAGVLVALPGQAGFLPGESVKGDVVLGSRADGVTLPRDALLYDGDQPFVFIAIGGKAQRRPVGLGIDDGARVEILTGLKAGDRVVIEGGAALEPDMALRESPATAKAPG